MASLSKIQFVQVIIVLLVSLTIAACDDKEDGFSVHGKISYLSQPVADALVFIDNQSETATATDAKGDFVLKGIKRGSHVLTLTKTDEWGAFSTTSEQILVSGELTLNNLVLPEPTILQQVPLEELSSQNKITLHWSPYISDDFKTYKLFTHSDSLFTETTGTLAFESIGVQDTTFELQLGLGIEKYFRVFVYDDIGQIAGSKVLHVSTTFQDPNEYVMSPEWKIIRVTSHGYGQAINYIGTRMNTVAGSVFIYKKNIGGESAGLFYPDDANLEEWNYANTINPAGVFIGPSYASGNFYALAGGTSGGIYFSGLFKSQDGRSWQKERSLGDDWQTLRDVWFVNDTVAYAIDNSGQLLYTTDRAETFTIRNAATKLEAIRFADNLNGYGSNNGRQFKTSDGGVTWIQTFAPMPGAAATFSYQDNSVGFAVTTNAKVYRSNDAGATWTLTTIHDDTLPNPATLWYYCAIGFQGSAAYMFITLDAAYPQPKVTYMYRSTDGGMNWNPDGRNIFLQANRMFIKDGHVYAMGMQDFSGGSNHWNVDSLAYAIILKRPL